MLHEQWGCIIERWNGLRARRPLTLYCYREDLVIFINIITFNFHINENENFKMMKYLLKRIKTVIYNISSLELFQSTRSCRSNFFFIKIYVFNLTLVFLCYYFLKIKQSCVKLVFNFSLFLESASSKRPAEAKDESLKFRTPA